MTFPRARPPSRRRSRRSAFTLSKTAKTIAAFPGEGSLRLAGFVRPETRKSLAETPYVWLPVERGQVVFFGDDPDFRAIARADLGYLKGNGPPSSGRPGAAATPAPENRKTVQWLARVKGDGAFVKITASILRAGTASKQVSLVAGREVSGPAAPQPIK